MEAMTVLGAVKTFSAMTLLRLRRRMRNAGSRLNIREGYGLDEPVRRRNTSDLDEPLRTALSRELTLAAEHVQSIWWLLEIARQHQQPIPRAALTNLDLTLRHLREVKKRI